MNKPCYVLVANSTGETYATVEGIGVICPRIGERIDIDGVSFLVKDVRHQYYAKAPLNTHTRVILDC